MYPRLKLTSRLTAMFGMRYEDEQNLHDHNNFAPRLGITYQVTPKAVLRAGYGRSYDVGVFGSVFGHTVTQNLPVLAVQNINAASNTARVFNLSQGPPAFNGFFGITTLPKNCPAGVCVNNTAIPTSGTLTMRDSRQQLWIGGNNANTARNQINLHELIIFNEPISDGARAAIRSAMQMRWFPGL